MFTYLIDMETKIKYKLYNNNNTAKDILYSHNVYTYILLYYDFFIYIFYSSNTTNTCNS